MDTRTGELVTQEQVERLPKKEQKNFEMVGDFTNEQIHFLQSKCTSRNERRSYARQFKKFNKMRDLRALKGLDTEEPLQELIADTTKRSVALDNQLQAISTLDTGDNNETAI